MQYNYQHELNVIYDVVQRNNFNSNIIEKKIHKRGRERIKQNPSNDGFTYCNMKC